MKNRKFCFGGMEIWGSWVEGEVFGFIGKGICTNKFWTFYFWGGWRGGLGSYTRKVSFFVDNCWFVFENTPIKVTSHHWPSLGHNFRSPLTSSAPWPLFGALTSHGTRIVVQRSPTDFCWLAIVSKLSSSRAFGRLPTEHLSPINRGVWGSFGGMNRS